MSNSVGDVMFDLPDTMYIYDVTVCLHHQALYRSLHTVIL